MKDVNSWLILVGGEVALHRYAVTVDDDSFPDRRIEVGDGVLIAAGDPLSVVSFARIYRVRASLDRTTFFFDGVVPVVGERSLADMGVTAPESKVAMMRLEWPVFEAALQTACGIAFDAMPVLDGDSTEEQAYVRELLQMAVIDDLLGPADGPVEEIVGMSVRDRYLVGKLAPMDTAPDAAETDNFGESGHPDSEERDEEVDTSTTRSLVPSSMGFTFCVDGELENIQLFANWGRYERTRSERENDETGKTPRCWKRIPSGGSAVVSLKKRTIEPIRIDANCPSVVVQGSVAAPLGNGDRLVTLFLVNTQTQPSQNQDQAWIFQPELVVRDMEGRAVFRRRPILRADEFDEERKALEMIYRNRVEFAVGHGISVHAAVSEADRERATEVRTVVLPEYEIQVTETPGLEPEDRPAMRRMIADGLLDMERLAELATQEKRDELIAGLKVLTEDYAEWIAENRNAIGSEVVGYDIPATEAMGRCNAILERLGEGIEVLAADDRALAAFRFANLAMASQRIHSIHALAKRRGDEVTRDALNVRKNRSWRPFQLAFILLSIPALADPTHRDRTQPLDAIADLLWFPTGGGKTEAYLGVAAFAMGIRRLQGDMGGLDGGRGLAVIMRYTLRLG